jgi:N6-adenosine-specific RNA methylase IME4
MNDAYPDFPTAEYDVALIDPPWSYYGADDKWAAAAKFYATMPARQIAEMPIPRILAPRAVAFVWATSPLLDVAVDTMRAWGLHFRGVAFVWVKSRADGSPIGAQGVRPSIVKPTAEYVLAGSRVARGRPMKLHNEGVRNVVLAPRREHSRKPEAVYDAIESLYPDARRVELFARTTRPGWDAWGNEIGKFQ